MDPRKLYVETMAEFAPLADQIKAVLMSPDDVTGRKTAALSWKEVKDYLTVDKAKELLGGSGTASNVVRGSIGALAGAGLGSMTVSKRSWESEEEYRRRKFRASMGYALTAGAVAGFAKPAFEKYVALSSAEDTRHDKKTRDDKLKDLSKIEESLVTPDGQPRVDADPLIDRALERVGMGGEGGGPSLGAQAHLANAAMAATNPEGFGGIAGTTVGAAGGGYAGVRLTNHNLINPAAARGLGQWGTGVRGSVNESRWLAGAKDTLNQDHPKMREGQVAVTKPNGKKVMAPDPSKPGLANNFEQRLYGPKQKLTLGDRLSFSSGTTSIRPKLTLMERILPTPHKMDVELRDRLKTHADTLSRRAKHESYRKALALSNSAAAGHTPKVPTAPSFPEPNSRAVLRARSEAAGIRKAQQAVSQFSREFDGSKAKRFGVRASGGIVGMVAGGALGNATSRLAHSLAKQNHNKVVEALAKKRDEALRSVPSDPVAP
jgi:hypothetical protein